MNLAVHVIYVLWISIKYYIFDILYFEYVKNSIIFQIQLYISILTLKIIIHFFVRCCWWLVSLICISLHLPICDTEWSINTLLICIIIRSYYFFESHFYLSYVYYSIWAFYYFFTSLNAAQIKNPNEISLCDK